MKKKILITILIILLLLTCIINYIKINNKKETIQNTTEKIKEPEIVSFKEVLFCKNKEICPITIENKYGELTFDYNDDSIQQWITKINQESENYYQESINSTTNNEICTNVKDIYNYQFIYRSYYINYIGEKYISLSTSRTKFDLCNNTMEELPKKTFLYDIKSKKQITQKELQKELNLSDNFIIEKIKTNIQSLDLTAPETFNYSDFTLYYDSFGNLLAEYRLPTKRNYSATIINH